MNNTEQEEKIVIYRLGSLGDTVVALPFFHAVAKLFPRARRVILTNVPVAKNAAPLEAVLGGSGLVHDYIDYPLGLRSLSGLLALRRRLMALGAHTLVYLQGSSRPLRCMRDYLFFRACGFSRVIGVPFTRDTCYPRIDPSTGTGEPECERLWRNMTALGPIDLKDPASWDLCLTPQERAFGHAALGPLARGPRIAINMGGKEPRKDWGEDNWCALLARVSALYPGYGLFIIGAPSDSERAGRFGAQWPGEFRNLCGGLSPRQSAAALEGAAIFIGHDSGPLHLASAVRVPCVGLFGDFNIPRVWHPYIGRNEIIHDMRGVLHISVDSAVKAVQSILDRPA